MSLTPAARVTLSGPIIPVYLAPVDSTGNDETPARHALVLPHESQVAIIALGNALVAHPVQPTIAILGSEAILADRDAIATAARDLVRRAIVSTGLRHHSPPFAEARTFVSRGLLVSGLMLLAVGPAFPGEYALQIGAGAWLALGLPLFRRAFRTASRRLATDRIDALRLAIGAETDRHHPGALAPVTVATHPALGNLATLIKNSPRDATRHCRELGIDALVPFYDHTTTRPSASPIWVMIPAFSPPIEPASDTPSSHDEPVPAMATDTTSPGDISELAVEKFNPIGDDESDLALPVIPEPDRSRSDQNDKPDPKGEMTPGEAPSPLSEETTPDHRDGDDAASPAASLPKEDGDGTVRPAAND
ncbi:MAG: hypothetical protein EXR45_03775 [Chloroflexi bacterium]|nr:hypothetical protein [Chloroflexota bacterium]